jgi:hypothetical protein
MFLTFFWTYTAINAAVIAFTISEVRRVRKYTRHV